MLLTDFEKRMYGVSGFFGGSKGAAFDASRHDEDEVEDERSAGHREWYDEHCGICRWTSELHGAGAVPDAETTTPDCCSNGDCRDAVDATLCIQSSTSSDSTRGALDTAAASAQLECVNGVEYCNAADDVAEA